MDEEKSQSRADKALDPEHQKNMQIMWKFLPLIRKRMIEGKREVCCDGDQRWVNIFDLKPADFTYLLCLAKANHWRRQREVNREREHD